MAEKAETSSFITQYVCRQTHSFSQSQFSTQYDLVHPLSIDSILFLPLKFI